MELSKNPRRKRILKIFLIVLAVVAFLWVLWLPQMGLRASILYKMECRRFDKVMKNASDEELFLVLRYAIANGFVPNREIDPFHDEYVYVGLWQRSLCVYESISHRNPNLLKQIYPDLDVLDDYVRWGHLAGEPYPDTAVTQAIKRNAQWEGQSLDSLMGDWEDKNSLHYQYFSTPWLWHM